MAHGVDGLTLYDLGKVYVRPLIHAEGQHWGRALLELQQVGQPVPVIVTKGVGDPEE